MLTDDKDLTKLIATRKSVRVKFVNDEDIVQHIVHLKERKRGENNLIMQLCYIAKICYQVMSKFIPLLLIYYQYFYYFTEKRFIISKHCLLVYIC